MAVTMGITDVLSGVDVADIARLGHIVSSNECGCAAEANSACASTQPCRPTDVAITSLMKTMIRLFED
jgi:hypothetical protein